MDQVEKDQALIYGPVIVTRGKHKGRIGNYDDDKYSGGCIVYFGELPLVKNFQEHKASHFVAGLSQIASVAA